MSDEEAGIMKVAFLFLFGSLAFSVEGSLIKGAGKDETNALLYLSKYGYLGKDDGTEALVTEENIGQYIKGAVKEFQAFAGVEILQQRIKVLSLSFLIHSRKMKINSSSFFKPMLTKLNVTT